MDALHKFHFCVDALLLNKMLIARNSNCGMHALNLWRELACSEKRKKEISTQNCNKTNKCLN